MFRFENKLKIVLTTSIINHCTADKSKFVLEFIATYSVPNDFWYKNANNANICFLFERKLGIVYT